MSQTLHSSQALRGRGLGFDATDKKLQKERALGLIVLITLGQAGLSWMSSLTLGDAGQPTVCGHHARQ